MVPAGLDIFLWGYLKNDVYRTRPDNIKELLFSKIVLTKHDKTFGEKFSQSNDTVENIRCHVGKIGKLADFLEKHEQDFLQLKRWKGWDDFNERLSFRRQAVEWPFLRSRLRKLTNISF